MPYKVFLSYAWKNSAERHALSTEIKQIENVEVLVDKEQIAPGQLVHPHISEMIDKANCVVVLLTEEGLQSREVLDEISRAHDRGKDIIPVVAKGTDMDSLPWYLRDVNWITYDERDFDATIDAIVKTIDKRANPMRQIEQIQLPKKLKKLIENGANYIDIPLPHIVAETIPRGAAEDFVFCELKMQETNVSFVFRAPALMRIGEAAEYLVNQTLPHLYYRDYDWTLKHKRREVPPDHTFKSAGIRTGDTVYLIGNARTPMWAPRMAFLGDR